MRITDARLAESCELLRKHLVKLHVDKDENSLFCRFSEIMGEIEALQWDVQSWQRVCNAISKHNREVKQNGNEQVEHSEDNKCGLPEA